VQKNLTKIEEARPWFENIIQTLFNLITVPQILEFLVYYEYNITLYTNVYMQPDTFITSFIFSLWPNNTKFKQMCFFS